MDKPRHRIISANPLKRYIADPGAMGLFAFAVVTFNSAAIHCRWASHHDAVIFAPAISYGGLCQVIAGVVDLFRGEKLSGSTFVAFGFYWITQGLWTIPTVPITAVYEAIDEVNGMKFLKGCYILGFAFVAFATTLASLRTTIAQIILLSMVTVDFAGLAIVNMTRNETLETIIGYILVATAALAWYIGTAFLLKDKSPIYLPLGVLEGTEDEDDPMSTGLQESSIAPILNRDANVPTAMV